tara:strand:- start:7894 stop:12528 length:4635 start_codon:yes stop_codon:yes gene_type:complete
MSIVSESFSTGFGVDGVIIEQTLFNSFDPYSGMDIDTSSFQNTNQGLENSNQDGRIELGMFTFDNDNQNSNNYPDILGSDFKVISKTNLIENGSGKYSLSIFKNPATGESEGYYIPQGGWGYCTYDGIEDRRRGERLYESNDDYSTGAYLEAGQTGRDFADTFVNGTYPYPELKDNQKRTGYAGYYAYFFDYRNLPANYQFVSTTIYANRNIDDGDQSEDWWDIKTWNTADLYIAANYMPNSWVRSRNTDEDGNETTISDMHIYRITDVTPGSPTRDKSVVWSTSLDRYVRGDYDTEDHGTNYYSDFQYFRRGNQYKFTFRTIYDDYDNSYTPTISLLKWSAFFNYREELEAFNEYRDEPIPMGAPLRLQQNLRHAIEQSNTENTCTNFLFMNHYDAFVGNHNGQYLAIDSDLGGYAEGSPSYAPITNITTPFATPRGWIDSPSAVSFPNIAKWIISNEAFSYGKCLEFLSTDFDESQENIGANQLDSNDSGYTTDRGFHWSVISPDFTDFGGATENQYRSLNQVIKFYDGGSDASSFLEPYSSIKVSFKMKTDSRFVGDYPQPEVELAVVDSDGDIYSPSRTLDFTQYDEVNGAGVFPYNKRHIYYPDGGEFNSQAYRDEYHTDNTVDKRTSFYGSVGRFKNSIMDEWEEFSYTFVLGDKFLYHQSQQLRRLFLIVQAANRFYGRVLLDDFEVVESYDFMPDVDVRKKISNGNYGKADLTKYYDKDLQPEQYKDSTAPLEAQFYFYPTYPTDEIFDVTRTPIYNDFKKGLFYIKDVDWGDGSAIEFSEPEQIDEEKALYHTYEEYGIFEVSGLMIRKKVDENDEELGVVHVKKFNLRININEGLDEDFNYFSDNGFSFIPYKNTLPVVGGISKQSAYYKSVKRQMGFIGNSKTFVEFKNKSDKLKTELALLKMENQNIDNLEVLPSYMIERYSVNNIFTIQWPGPDLEVNTTNIPDNIIGILGDSVAANFQDGNWVGTIPTLQFGEIYSFITSVPLYNFSWDIISDNNLNLLPPSSNIIYNGISPIKEELGKGIGDCDLTSIKYYNEPKSIWELFGFEIIDTSVPLDVFDYIDTTPEYLMTLPFPQYFEEFDIQTLGNLNQLDVGLWISQENARPDIAQLILQIILGNGTENNPQLNQYNYPDYVFDWQSPNDIPFGNDLSQPHSYFTNPTVITANQIINESVGNPASIRYWKNIIPKDYPIFHRDGLVDFLKISPPLDALKQYDSSDATTTFENLPLGLIPSGNLPDVEGWYGNNFDERFLMGYWDMGIVEIDDLPGYEKAIRIVTRYNENSPYDNRSWGGFYRSFITANNIPTMFGGWFKVLNGGMEYGNLNTSNRISKNPDYGNSNNGWEFFVSPLNESSFQSDSEGNGCHFYSWVNESNPDGEVLIAGLFAFNDEEFFTTLHNFVESGEEQDYKLGFNTYSTRNIVDTYAEQDWFGDYYYPALPKYGQDGKFIEDTLVDNKIPFPLQGPITDETESNENLIINIISETTEDNVFDDKSGNENLGFGISDYKPKFNNETLKPLKRNTFNKIKTSKRNGAF